MFVHYNAYYLLHIPINDPKVIVMYLLCTYKVDWSEAMVVQGGLDAPSLYTVQWIEQKHKLHMLVFMLPPCCIYYVHSGLNWIIGHTRWSWCSLPVESIMYTVDWTESMFIQGGLDAPLDAFGPGSSTCSWHKSTYSREYGPWTTTCSWLWSTL